MMTHIFLEGRETSRCAHRGLTKFADTKRFPSSCHHVFVVVVVIIIVIFYFFFFSVSLLIEMIFF